MRHVFRRCLYLIFFFHFLNYVNIFEFFIDPLILDLIGIGLDLSSMKGLGIIIHFYIVEII